MDRLDKALEEAIDSAGRGRVFALAEGRGWGPGATPPKWVWWELVMEAQRSDQITAPQFADMSGYPRNIPSPPKA